jgi:hypothetical protein
LFHHLPLNCRAAERGARRDLGVATNEQAYQRRSSCLNVAMTFLFATVLNSRFVVAASGLRSAFRSRFGPEPSLTQERKSVHCAAKKLLGKCQDRAWWTLRRDHVETRTDNRAENREAKRKGEKPLYTLIIVTHELNEALYVGDRVAGLSQYWDWMKEGFAICPGATIVYDKVSPVFDPHEKRDLETFKEQREEIRRAVFNTEVRQDRNEHVTYWTQASAGLVEGIRL